MIPISLTIKGLFSYQKEQTIHFDRLIEGQLFGIFGTVGSGKSSILEAIAFALYGETERLNTRDDRNYNMMNLKSDELLIDFIFSNFDGRHYRFVVKGKRHGKRFEKVNTFERSAYIRDEATWQPLAETTAESLLGLSYENFRRTIIIPQGKFQEFLQLTDKARTDMLKDIFQLDKYEFSPQTVSLERKNNEVMQRIGGRLSVFEQVSETDVELTEKELQLVGAEIASLTLEIKEQESNLRKHEQLKRLFDERNEAELRYKDLQEKLSDYQLLKQQLNNYEYCERHFKANLQRTEELLAGIAKREESLKEYQYKLKLCETLLMQQQQELANIILKYQSLDLLNQQLNDYRTALDILKLKEDIEHLRERVVKGRAFIHKAQQEKIHREKTAVELREKIKIKRSERPDLNVISQIKNWFTGLELLRKNKDVSQLAFDELQKALTQIKNAISDLLVKSGLSQDNYEATLKQSLQTIDERLEKIADEIAHAQMQVKLGDFAAALHRGEPCPLCGSSEHPEILALENVESGLQQLNNQYNHLKQEKNATQELMRQLEILQVKESTILKNKEEAHTRLQADEQTLTSHLQSFRWSSSYDKDDIQTIDRLLVVHQEIETVLASLEEEVNINDTLLAKAASDRDHYELAIQKIVEEERLKTGSLNSLLKQLQGIAEEEVYTYELNQLEDKIQDIDKECKYITDKYNELQKQVNEQQQLKISLESRYQAVNENKAAEEERLTFINDQLQASLIKSEFNSLAEVKTLLNLAIPVEEVRSNVDLFFQQFYNAKEQYSKLLSSINEENYNEELFLKSIDLHEQLKDRLREKQEKYAGVKTGYERLLKQLEEKQQLEIELQQLQQRAANLSLLKNLFKGSGFVSYVSTVYLQQLCEAANKRFYKLTQQQLRLEVTDKNEFQVRDYLNDGKTRLAKTLSGGQTFQASLSLALALAESVQQQNKSEQNFFFLDEGFGSLDKESLAVAFDTLKTLRNENRIVGIISHVEELQQEIDVYLRIKNDPFIGTQVSGSWENK